MAPDTCDTNLLNYFGKSPELKLLDFLIENRRTSWNITELEQQGGIARSTLKAVIPKMLELELVQVERTIGRSQLLVINTANPVIATLMRLSRQIDELENGKRAAARKIPGARRAGPVRT